MIEPLKTTRESNEGFTYDDPLTLERINAKLNEVIEVVNLQQSLLDYWTDSGFAPMPNRLPYPAPPRNG